MKRQVFIAQRSTYGRACRARLVCLLSPVQISKHPNEYSVFWKCLEATDLRSCIVFLGKWKYSRKCSILRRKSGAHKWCQYCNIWRSDYKSIPSVKVTTILLQTRQHWRQHSSWTANTGKDVENSNLFVLKIIWKTSKVTNVPDFFNFE